MDFKLSPQHAPFALRESRWPVDPACVHVLAHVRKSARFPPVTLPSCLRVMKDLRIRGQCKQSLSYHAVLLSADSTS